MEKTTQISKTEGALRPQKGLRRALAPAITALLSLAVAVGCQSKAEGDGTSASGASTGGGPVVERTILNVSYDPTRGLYEDYNAWFVQHWKETSGEKLSVEVSHGGSGRQARSVIDGLQADVVTLALAPDIDVIAEKAGLLNADWATEFASQSAPYTSAIVFLVRKGNPKNIRDWNDLVRGDVSIIHPNPKTSGGARWGFMAAWGYALHQPGGSEESAREYLRKFFQAVPVLDSGARGSTTTFARNGIGDVLVSWENEAHLLQAEMPNEGFEIVIPSESILAIPPVAIVDKVVDARGTRDVATAYLQGLYSDEGQRIAGRHSYRPSNPTILAEFKERFPDLKLFTIEEIGGSWADAQERFFGDGGVFDQIYVPQR